MTKKDCRAQLKSYSDPIVVIMKFNLYYSKQKIKEYIRFSLVEESSIRYFSFSTGKKKL